MLSTLLSNPQRNHLNTGKMSSFGIAVNGYFLLCLSFYLSTTRTSSAVHPPNTILRAQHRLHFKKYISDAWNDQGSKKRQYPLHKRVECTTYQRNNSKKSYTSMILTCKAPFKDYRQASSKLLYRRRLKYK